MAADNTRHTWLLLLLLLCRAALRAVPGAGAGGQVGRWRRRVAAAAAAAAVWRCGAVAAAGATQRRRRRLQHGGRQHGLEPCKGGAGVAAAARGGLVGATVVFWQVPPVVCAAQPCQRTARILCGNGSWPMRSWPMRGHAWHAPSRDNWQLAAVGVPARRSCCAQLRAELTCGGLSAVPTGAPASPQSPAGLPVCQSIFHRPTMPSCPTPAYSSSLLLINQRSTANTPSPDPPTLPRPLQPVQHAVFYEAGCERCSCPASAGRTLCCGSTSTSHGRGGPGLHAQPAHQPGIQQARAGAKPRVPGAPGARGRPLRRAAAAGQVRASRGLAWPAHRLCRQCALLPSIR